MDAPDNVIDFLEHAQTTADLGLEDIAEVIASGEYPSVVVLGMDIMGIALGTVMLYLISVRIAQAMGAGGVLPPALAAWVPNLVFLGIGVTLLARTRT